MRPSYWEAKYRIAMEELRKRSDKTSRELAETIEERVDAEYGEYR